MTINEKNETENFKAIYPVLRQVHLIAACLIFSAFLGTHFIYPGLIYLALLVGVGLTISGLTGHCPMVYLLQKLPWNQVSSCCSSDSKKGNCCS